MYQSKWYPPAGSTRHTGGTIPQEMDFFTPPPPEIGSVSSANSTLTITTEAMEPSKRWMLVLGGAFVGGFIIQMLPRIFGLAGIGIGWLIYPTIIACIVGLVIYIKTQFSHQCSYVGDRGIVEYELSGSRNNQPKTKLLLFPEVKDLYTSQTRTYTNGVYTGTRYDYKWVKKAGGDFHLSGQYYNQNGWPKEEDRWHLANSAEAAWSNYRLQLLNDELSKLGYVEFAMSGNPKAVRIGSNFIEFLLKDNSTQRVAIAEMKKISLGQGIFQFIHSDAKWWSGKGKYSFSYANLPNAKLFLIYLDHLTGIRWN